MKSYEIHHFPPKKNSSSLIDANATPSFFFNVPGVPGGPRFRRATAIQAQDRPHATMWRPQAKRSQPAGPSAWHPDTGTKKGMC